MPTVFEQVSNSVIDVVSYVVSREGVRNRSGEELLGLFEEAIGHLHSLGHLSGGRIYVSFDDGVFTFNMPGVENFQGCSIGLDVVHDLISLHGNSGRANDGDEGFPSINLLEEKFFSQGN